VEEKTVPLICASCAEKHQVPYLIEGRNEYWGVNEKGKIWKDIENRSQGETNILRVVIPEKKKVNSLEDLDWIPAYIDEAGKCYVEEFPPIKLYDDWEELRVR
jgi:hypothetical protein